jgi:hypothetical protein
VIRSFNCKKCEILKSLKGAPQEVGNDCWCCHCPKLTSLEGAPKEVGGSFNCYECGKEFTEDDVEKLSKVKGKIRV